MDPVKKLIAFLIVVAALLVVADRVAAWEAEQMLASRLASAYQLGQQPTVHIQGVPFLTQWASGRYQELDVDLPSATAGQVTVSDVSAQLKDISAKPFATSGSDVRGATIGSLTVKGLVPYSSLPVPKGFTAQPDAGKLKLTGSIAAFGQSIPVTAIVSVTAQDGRVVPTLEQVDTSNAFLKATITATIRQQLQSLSFLQNLPLGVQVDSVAVSDGGLQVTGSARQVLVPQQQPAP
jgi:hypothetical protein